MTKTTNPLRIGHPDEEGEEMQQTVLLYFQENKRRVFAIVMLVADEKAQADLTQSRPVFKSKNKSKYESIYPSQASRKKEMQHRKMPVDFLLLLPVCRN